MTSTALEVETTNADLIRDSEQSALPKQGPAVQAAQDLFNAEAEEDKDHATDITKIIKSCLKDINKIKSKRALKMLSQIISVSEYIKLRARYRQHSSCTCPCLNASMAIARRMGKGPYYARQIRYNKLFLLKNHHLPPPRSFVKHGHHSLLDNEAVLHDVRVYLAAQSLGTISPHALCHHVNDIILPTLGIRGTIVESTAQRWLKFKLGYTSKEGKKGMYVDGHKHPDVIKERKAFLEILGGYEQYMPNA
jgi:hypothetical protein